MSVTALDPAAYSDGNAKGAVSSSQDEPTCAFPGCMSHAIPDSSFCGDERHTSSTASQTDGTVSPQVDGLAGSDGTGRSRKERNYRPRRGSRERNHRKWHAGELRVVESQYEGDTRVRISGTAIVYSPWTTIYGEEPGPFKERILPSAFDAVQELRNADDRFLLWQHDWKTPPLASVRGGSLHLRNTDTGLQMAADLDPKRPLVQEIVSAIRAGALKGMSFAFLVDPDGGEEWNADMSHRTISKFLDVPEVTLTPRPAYPQTQLQVDRTRVVLEAQLMRSRLSRRELEIKRSRQRTGMEIR